MYCGFDFGTSNSTFGISTPRGCRLIPLEGDKLSIRSAIFCDNDENQWVFGQEGIEHYLEGSHGRLMMAIKSLLGSSLMEEKTVIFNQLVPYTHMLSVFVQHIKQKAETFAGQELTHLVLGRPVRFHDDNDDKDRLAQTTLETIVRDAGFKEITFQYEPIAAAIAYETSITKEQLALIVDMGGGTSDFTIIRLRPKQVTASRKEDVLSYGGIHIAGTDFDKRISLNTVMPTLGMGSTAKNSGGNIVVPSSFYHDLTQWHLLNQLYNSSTIARVQAVRTMANEKHLLSRLMYVLQHRLGHYILETVETNKQLLSNQLETTLDLSFIENNLNVLLTRSYMNKLLAEYIQKIVAKILQTVEQAGVKPSDINAVFYTGGSTKIPEIHNTINPLFPEADIIQGDAFGSVGLGLTIDAERQYGANFQK